MSLKARRAQAGNAQIEWQALSVTERLSRLNPLRSLIVERADEIIASIQKDVGKTPLDALSGDILVSLEFLAFAVRSAPQALASKAVPRDTFLYWNTKFREEYVPYGVVLVLSPWNYPFQLSLIPTLSALIAGNAVILKTSEFAPNTASQIERLLASIDLPLGLVQVLCGDSDLGRELLDAAPDFIFFTGSSKGGREVAIAGAKKLIPSILELGGKDAAIVFSDALLERTIEGTVYAAFANCGQVCVGAKRILIEKSILESFSNSFVDRCAKLKVGDTLDSDFGFPCGAVRIDQIEHYVKDAIKKGARLVGSKAVIPFESPIILADVTENAEILREEVFGPIVCLETFTDESEAILKVNSSDYGLGASIWTADKARAARVAGALKVGTCSINDAIFQIGNPAASFGGVRASGWGRYRGDSGFRSFCNTKSVMERTGSGSRERHWFPATPKTFKELKAILSLKHGKNKIINKLLQVLSLVLLVFSIIPSISLGQEHGTLQLIVSGFKEDDTGKIAYAVFDNLKGFPSDKDLALRKDFVTSSPRTTEGSLKVKIPDLPYGIYAISIYLDENGDHKLNKNFLGIPLEPAGASQNPPGRLGPPRFNECVIEFNSKSEPYLIKLVR